MQAELSSFPPPEGRVDCREQRSWIGKPIHIPTFLGDRGVRLEMTLDADADMSLAAAKQQLRSLMKKRLAAVNRDNALAQSRAIMGSLLTWAPYMNAKRISVFLSMPSGEVQTDAIVRHALSTGKDVYIPYLHKSPLDTPDTPSRVMDMVRLKDLSDYESLKPDKWGIPSVDPSTVHERQRILGGPDAHHSERATLDLMLMPGVAFDIDPASGLVRRCGHGKGFYDFFVQRYASKITGPGDRESSSILLVGLGLTEQFLASQPDMAVPMGPLDRRLDGLILGNGDIKSSKLDQQDR
ncbi:hypothetical protein PpBr36_00965 [Pyricularia pennisetigena]|uniref:hypothetical protein n=1 Tax=Pyricularia pennisetigena TaxID=1578925 RepID=UPI001152E61C|nr:hypothetical protein PpBr36_00965 [Pyricularia pennisetigena]TLS29637.1 hypothetical protein PpBr36_00965 [Pyricularia pennisetigena]